MADSLDNLLRLINLRSVIRLSYRALILNEDGPYVISQTDCVIFSSLIKQLRQK